MPIVIEVVSREDYQAWLDRAKNFYADGAGLEGSRLAENTGQ